MTSVDYYEVLQVASTAEVEVIRAAYKQLAFKYHPDRNREPSAQTKMQQINEAYEVLADAERRRSYDAKRLDRRDGDSKHKERPTAPPKPTQPKAPPVPKAKPARPMKPRPGSTPPPLPKTDPPNKSRRRPPDEPSASPTSPNGRPAGSFHLDEPAVPTPKLSLTGSAVAFYCQVMAPLIWILQYLICCGVRIEHAKVEVFIVSFVLSMVPLPFLYVGGRRLSRLVFDERLIALMGLWLKAFSIPVILIMETVPTLRRGRAPSFDIPDRMMLVSQCVDFIIVCLALFWLLRGAAWVDHRAAGEPSDPAEGEYVAPR